MGSCSAKASTNVDVPVSKTLLTSADENKPKASTSLKEADFCSIHPYFTILDEEAVKPILEEFVNRTKTESGCLYYGFTVDGDKLFCREAYVNGEAVLAHLNNVDECIQRILADGVAKLDRIEIHGPSAELEKVKDATAALGTVYFDLDSSFMVGSVGDAEVEQQLCTVQPYFTLLNEENPAVAREIMQEFVERTKSESGCLYYGWTLASSQLFCREAYVNGEAVLAHLANVDECIKKILADGVARLDRIEIHGPADELEKVKEATAALGTKYFAIDSGFQRYGM